MWFRHNPKFIFWVVNIFLNKINQLLIFQRGFTTTETLICPGWETLVVPVSQPGTPGRDKWGCSFVLGLATGTKSNTNRDKRVCQCHMAGAPFCPGWCYQPGEKVPFFHVFLFSILFLFQLYFCISIKLMYWNSVCKISTNIYIYIVTYIIFVLDSFHI